MQFYWRREASSTTKTGRHDIAESGVKTSKIKNQSTVLDIKFKKKFITLPVF